MTRRSFIGFAAQCASVGLISSPHRANGDFLADRADSEWIRLGAVEMGSLLRLKEISPVELVEAHIAQFAGIQRATNAATHTPFAAALRAARAAERAILNGEVDWQSQPLFGLPFSVKNHIDVAGIPTTAAVRGWKYRIATSDADVVDQLRRGGAISFCTTNLPCLAFAYDTNNSLFGRTNNPYDIARSAGGSSGGEGALVAACGSPLGVGSDHNGSIRVPCAWNGLAGLRPTPERISLRGMHPQELIAPQAWSIGPIARRVRDLEIALPFFFDNRAAAKLLPLSDSRRIDLKGLRIAYLTKWSQASSVPTRDIQNAVAKSIKLLEQNNASIVGELPASFYRIGRATLGAMLGKDQFAIDGFRNTIKTFGCEDDGVLQDVLGWIQHYQTSVSIEQQRDDANEFSQLQKQFAGFMDDVDAIILPVHAHPAMLHGTVWPYEQSERSEDKYSYCYFCLLSGRYPAGTVRVDVTTEGLPIGVQIIGREYRDDIVLRVMAELEAAFGGWQPPANTTESR
ncbi:MAG: amidase [Pirellulaceae bacterium]